MNKIIPVAVCVLMAGSLLADGAKAEAGSKRPPRDHKLIMERMRKLQIAKEGGMVENLEKAKGIVIWANCQDLIPEGVIVDAMSEIRQMFRVRMTCRRVAGGIKTTDFAQLEKKMGGDGLIAFVDDKGMPTTILTAPEGHWAVVNVAALAADNPRPEVLIDRVVREAWRSFAFLFGAADSRQRNCAMHPVGNLNMLDSLPARQFCPEPANKINLHLAALGFTNYAVATYRKACEEGWAPAPTNDAQKAVWDKVHQMPTEPLKIKPETKKVSD